MLHPAWIEREAPLPRCPVAACRRSKICQHPTDKDPCRRLHETKDAARNALAENLRRITDEIIRRNPEGRVIAKPGTREFELRLKALKQGLEAREAEEAARLRALKHATMDS